jgi:predicted AlkP superfamily pyrophosphatase or phosphodiesterase
MNNSYDEIKKLLKASNNMLGKNGSLNEEIISIRKSYGMISEQEDLTQKINPIEDAEKKIEDETESKSDKQQSYRISGGVITLHGKENADLELTTDDKMSFQETMDEFVNEVSDLVDFEPLNVYKTDVEWGGKIIDFDIQFYFTLGENNGIYIDGTMIKVDENFLNMLNKLEMYYEKFKTKWAKVLASRKKTSPKPVQEP